MKAKWIWHNKKISSDQYAEFITQFNSNTGHIKLNISADTNYAIYLNGNYIKASQYACFPYEPIMDSISLNAKKGLNDLKIIVYYCFMFVNNFFAKKRPFRKKNDRLQLCFRTGMQNAKC